MAKDEPAPYVAPPITSRAPKPAGILPKHAQALAIGGISLVMVLVIAFSGRNAPKERAPVPSPASSVVDPNEERIRDYRTRIDQQMQKLALEQARVAQAKQTLGGVVAPTPDGANSYPAGFPTMTTPSEYNPSSTSENDSHWIERDLIKRAYESRYASNIALSHRNRLTATEEQPAIEHASTTGEPASARDAKERSNASPELQKAAGKTYRLFEGTVLETVLTNRLDGSFSGPVNCLLSTNVYSHDRLKLLMPQGSRVLGEVSRVEAFGQQRLAVAFHRVIMPDGFSVSLDALPGLSAAGETGLVDQINHHYLQVFGVSIAIGAIAGLSQANTQYGVGASAEDAYRQGVATSLSQSSLNVLNRYLNVLPTFTIREGHRIKVYLTADLDLPAYQNHRIPRDL